MRMTIRSLRHRTSSGTGLLKIAPDVRMRCTCRRSFLRGWDSGKIRYRRSCGAAAAASHGDPGEEFHALALSGLCVPALGKNDDGEDPDPLPAAEMPKGSSAFKINLRKPRFAPAARWNNRNGRSRKLAADLECAASSGRFRTGQRRWGHTHGNLAAARQHAEKVRRLRWELREKARRTGRTSGDPGEEAGDGWAFCRHRTMMRCPCCGWQQTMKMRRKNIP